ncbi:MAG: hypothetical protein Kow0092_27490 [Deferrisomatales bacterium]
MATLDGSARTVELAPGYRISAQGLQGTATAHEGAPAGRRGGGPEGATPALDQALAAAGMNEIKLIELDVRAAAPPPAEAPIRTARGEEGLVLEVPDLGPTVGQVVLAVDEEGVATWDFPVDAAGRPQPPATRGAGGAKRFVIRRTVAAPPPPAEGEHRGLVGCLGRKLLKVIVYPLVDPVLGAVADYFAGRWERENRPYGLRRFDPESYRSPQAPDLTREDWARLAAGPSLLFVHGTFSTAHGGFAGLPEQTLAELHRRYGGRVFAFNHFTLSEDPAENAAWLRGQMPQGTALEVDLVCHSRGGLVARTLAGQLPGVEVPGLRVRTVVFVGAPNRGTALTDTAHLVDLVDRYTSLLNLAPPGPLSAVAEVLEGVAVVVKVLGSAALTGLEGLAAMNPRGEFLERLRGGPDPGCTLYAVASDFEPQGSLRQLVQAAVADAVMDRVFGGSPNDLVVPTDGVRGEAGVAGFPVPEDRTLRFSADRGVTHTRYFQQPETSEALLAWLHG